MAKGQERPALDDLDRRLMEVLQVDGRRPFTEIAAPLFGSSTVESPGLMRDFRCKRTSLPHRSLSHGPNLVMAIFYRGHATLPSWATLWCL